MASSKKSILKTSTQAASALNELEAATTVNEVGSAYHVEDQPQSQHQSFRQSLGDKERERRWIRSNISMKICCSYRENPKLKDYCMCGRRKHKEHTPEALDNPCEGKWSADSEECVQEMPTTAYGEIEFPNANIAKFVRVAADTDMDDVMCLLTKYWGLQKPNLLISVTGGAKNITMSKKLKVAFKTGLLKTAQTTGAWILSGGNHDGVMKYVGEAVNMLQSSSKVVAFGIAPWGTVANKRELSSAQGVWPAYYQLRDEVSKGSKNANLDPNHTHFMLVITELSASLVRRSTLEGSWKSVFLRC
ncbi:TRPM2 [Bugula neritina]|uniref:TRPM2 n=1 Tax=Bugula neritina TaxID=10212 RepID=A0A7J7KSK1_BUGNE|nr:TRPM2 [Bugula neritina]